MIEIRPASHEDLPALISLYEQLEDQGMHWSQVEFSPRDISLSAQVFARLEHYPDYKVYLAEAGGEIVGTLALLIVDSVPNGIPSGIVENLVVARTWRGQGVGRRLMRFAIEKCRSKGCFELSLSSRLGNETAHHFYESLGLRLAHPGVTMEGLATYARMGGLFTTMNERPVEAAGSWPGKRL